MSPALYAKASVFSEPILCYSGCGPLFHRCARPSPCEPDVPEGDWIVTALNRTVQELGLTASAGGTHSAIAGVIACDFFSTYLSAASHELLADEVRARGMLDR